jgi:uncharacterized protein (TIGR03437 family)
MAVSADGRVTLAGIGYSDPLPSTDDLAPPPLPGSKKVFLAQFDLTGATLLRSGYVIARDVAQVAPLSEGAVALITSGNWSSGSRVTPTLWAIDAASASALQVTGIRSAFAPTAQTAVSPGSIVSIAVRGLPADNSIYLGMAPPAGAPTQLGGVTVEVNGVNAPLLGMRPGEIIAIIPARVAAPGTAELTIRTAEGLRGTSFIELAESAPWLYPDVRNVDGSLNSATNPATAGTPVTFFATGISAPQSAIDGTLAPSNAEPSPSAVYAYIPETRQSLTITDLRPVPGFVYGIYYSTLTAPDVDSPLTLQLGQSSVTFWVRKRQP